MSIVEEHHQSFNYIHVSTTMHRLAKRAQTPRKRSMVISDPGFETLERVIVVHLPECQPQAITNIAWAWATLGHHPGDATIDALAGEAMLRLADFNPQAITNLAWAWATLGQAL